MKTPQEMRDSARNRKRQERERYRQAGLIPKTVQIPNSYEAISALDLAVKKIVRKHSK